MEKKVHYLLLVLLFISTVNFGFSSSKLLTYEYDLDYSEGFVIEDAQRLIDEGQLYPEPTLENGFESVKYPPVFYMIFAGIGILSGKLGFLAGRLIVFSGLIGSFLLIEYLINRKGGGNLFLKSIPLLLFTSYLSIYTGLTLRVDIIAIFFSLAGITLFLENHRTISIPLFLLAFFTKQTFIAAFIACFLYSLNKRKWQKDILSLKNKETNLQNLFDKYRDLIKIGLIYTLSILSLFILLQLSSSGNFITNIVSSNIGGLNIRYDLLNWAHLTFLPLFGLSAYYIYIFKDTMFGSYFLISLLIAHLQILRGGAWVYPFMEPFIVSIICVGLLWKKAEFLRSHISKILILQIVILLMAPLISGTLFDVTSIMDNKESDQRIAETVKNVEGPVFTEHVGYQIVNGLEPSPEIWNIYEGYSSGKISDNDVKKFFKEKNYTKIVAYKRIYSLPIQDYLKRNYEVIGTLERKDMILNKEKWRIYRWRD